MNWLLALAYFAHFVATVVWVGGLALLSLVIWPVVKQTLSPEDASKVMFGLQKRFSPLAILSLAVLTGTGLMQMSAAPQYEGLLVIDNGWSIAILIKHIGYAVMVIIGAYLTWGLLPKLAHNALLMGAGKEPDGLIQLQKRQARLHYLNFACGLFVLLFTAIARVL